MLISRKLTSTFYRTLKQHLGIKKITFLFTLHVAVSIFSYATSPDNSLHWKFFLEVQMCESLSI